MVYKVLNSKSFTSLTNRIWPKSDCGHWLNSKNRISALYLFSELEFGLKLSSFSLPVWTSISKRHQNIELCVTLRAIAGAYTFMGLQIDIYHLCKFPWCAIMDFCLHVVKMCFFFRCCTLSGSETICKRKPQRRRNKKSRITAKEDSLTAGRQQISFRTNILSAQHGGRVHLLQVKADDGHGKTLYENKVPTVIHLSSVLRCQHSAAKCAALVVIDGPPSSTRPPLLSGVGLHAVPGYMCVIYGALIGSDSAAWGAGLHKLQSFAKALNNHSLSLAVSVKPSGGTSHPQLLHSCHTCTLALHIPPGALPPLKAMFTIPFVSWFERESDLVRGCVRFFTTVQEQN